MKSKLFYLQIIIVLFLSLMCFANEPNKTTSKTQDFTITKEQTQKPSKSQDITKEQTKVSHLPEALFTDTSYNFDSLLEGEPIEHDFIVKNNGSAALSIERVKTG